VREYLGADDIANTIMMMRTAFKGTIAVVEGITDRRLYGKFFDDRDVNVIIAHSKTNVRDAVHTVCSDRRCTGVIGIVDADLDYLMGRVRKPPIFITDTRDSEMMMLKSTAAKDVLAEYASPELMERFVDRYGDVISTVLNACYPVGLLMYVSEKQGFNLSFKDLDFETFIDRRTLHCDLRRMIDEVMFHTGGGPSPKYVLACLEKEMQDEHDPWIVCRGHDAMAVFAIALKYIFCGGNCRYIQESELAGGFRLAYDRSDLVGTKLFTDTSAWCSEHGMKLWQ
jgi:hypothetical protein